MPYMRDDCKSLLHPADTVHIKNGIMISTYRAYFDEKNDRFLTVYTGEGTIMKAMIEASPMDKPLQTLAPKDFMVKANRSSSAPVV